MELYLLHLGQSLELYFLEGQLYLIRQKELILHSPFPQLQMEWLSAWNWPFDSPNIVTKVGDSVSVLFSQVPEAVLSAEATQKGLCSTVSRVG